MKSWIAIDLDDFHDPSKKWQSGTVETVRVRVVGGKTLGDAKQTAQMENGWDTYNDHAWYVFPLDNVVNVQQKPLLKGVCL